VNNQIAAISEKSIFLYIVYYIIRCKQQMV